jgi:hypothetical protein
LVIVNKVRFEYSVYIRNFIRLCIILARNADNLTAISEQIVLKMWEPRCLTTLSANMVCYHYLFMYNIISHGLCIIIKVILFIQTKNNDLITSQSDTIKNLTLAPPPLSPNGQIVTCTQIYRRVSIAQHVARSSLVV